MGKMYFPGEKPSAEDKQNMMDKESWIQSRTDNPDRLGRDFWNKLYDDSMNGGLPFLELSEDIKQQMTNEYLSRNGLVLDDKEEWEKVFSFVGNFAKHQPTGNELKKIFDDNPRLPNVSKKKSSTLHNTIKKGQAEYASTVNSMTQQRINERK